jgi:hypothetical protein
VGSNPIESAKRTELGSVFLIHKKTTRTKADCFRIGSLTLLLLAAAALLGSFLSSFSLLSHFVRSSLLLTRNNFLGLFYARLNGFLFFLSSEISRVKAEVNYKLIL